MSRYIEYDAIDYRNDKMHDKSSDFIDGVIYMAQRIEEAPSIDIVHCRECKFAEIADKTDDQDGYTCQFHRGSIWFSGSFCSWGKRKESE